MFRNPQIEPCFNFQTCESVDLLSICNIYLFPALVLRAGFAFWLLQFLFIAFLLLLVIFAPVSICFSYFAI